MTRPIIEVRNVAKRYQLGAIGMTSLRDEAERFWERLRHGRATTGNGNGGARANEFWALRDVSFDVQQGDVVGIIGRNGAGKSTLLKILSRITQPTKGEVTLRGRIASLLEVGTGFHPELSGRENIFLNGAILGMTKAEIRKNLDAIVSFAEMDEFIDTPVKRYSSGMYVRLAFAVAAHLEPEILIVDEVLAVGDAAFQTKCLGKMESVAQAGRTVLFVSHNMGAIRKLCGQGIWLHQGRVRNAGRAHEIIPAYEEALTGVFSESSCVADRNKEIDPSRLHFSRVEVTDRSGTPACRFKYGEVLVLDVGLGGELAGDVFSAEFHIYNELGVLVCGGGSGPYHGEFFSSRVTRLRIEIGPLTITSGRYRILLSMMAGSVRIDTWENAISFTITECQPFRTSWDIPAHREGACVLQHSFQAVD